MHRAFLGIALSACTTVAIAQSLSAETSKLISSVLRGEVRASAQRAQQLQAVTSSVVVGSALSPTYLQLATESEFLTPSLSQTHVGGLSISQLRAEKPYQKKDEAAVRRTVEGAYPNAPQDIQQRLIDILMDVDARLYEFHQNVQGSQLDDALLLKYAYLRAQIVSKVFRFERDSLMADPNDLPVIVRDFDRELSTIMIRGRRS